MSQEHARAFGHSLCNLTSAPLCQTHSEGASVSMAAHSSSARTRFSRVILAASLKPSERAQGRGMLMNWLLTKA